LRGAGGCLVVWLLTRAGLVVAVHVPGYPQIHAVTGDVDLYARWATLLAHGHFPVADPQWQYPPGAAAVLLIPRLLFGGYHRALVELLVAVDLAVLLLLLRRGRDVGTYAGAWTWVLGLAALGPIVVNRFDVVPTALAVFGLSTGAPWLAGVLLGAGALVKLWPAPLLVGVRRPAPATLAGAVLVAVSVVVLLAVGRLGPAVDFMHNQRARGLQIESVAATPLMIAHAFGGYRVVHEYGAFDIIGPLSGIAVRLTTYANVAVLLGYVALGLRLRRSRTYDPVGLALAAVLALIVTARVLSPQYQIWVLGLAALHLCTRRDRPRTTAVMLVAAAAVTQLLYPSRYIQLLHGGGVATGLLVARNVLLLAATVAAVRAYGTTARVMARYVITPKPTLETAASATNRLPR
jgi:hypothetical protein